MKFKFFTIFMAIAVALAFSSCDKKKSHKGGGDDDNSDKSESVEKGPTGDPAKDAKIALDETLSLMERAASEDNFKNLEKKGQAIEKKYEEFYKDNPEDLRKFRDEVEKLKNDPDYKSRIEKAQKKIYKKMQEVMNKDKKAKEDLARPSSDYDDYAEEAVSKATEAVETIEDYEYEYK